MSHSECLRRRASYLLLLACIAWLPAASQGADFRQSSSLKFVPQDVEFYSSSMRLREQYDAFVHSKAFAALKQMPYVQLGLGMLKQQWDNPEGKLAPLKAWLDRPENKQLLALLADAASHEIFLYGGSGYADALQLVNDVNQGQRLAMVEAMKEQAEPGKVLVPKVLEAVAARLDGMKMPVTVIGFKLSDPRLAVEQLARLEKFAPALLALVPQGAERFTRQKIAGGEFLSLRLDGGLIPWEALLEEHEEYRAQLEKLAEKIKKRNLTISLGVWNDCLILSFGESNEHLRALGRGPLLAERKELAPLARVADRRLAAVSYVSEGFRRQVGGGERPIDQLAAAGLQLLPLAKLDDAVEKEVRNDLQELASTIKRHLPKPGAAASFAFLTERGYEGFSYDWGEHPAADASQQLSILQHVGGNPILFVAGRSRWSPQCYDALAKYATRALYYAEKIGLGKLSVDEREQYAKVKKELEPLAARLDRAIRDMLIPALRDGQAALVVDARAVSTQWHQAMPAARQPLPMLEIALVLGVSDATLLKKGARECFDVLQAAIDKLNALVPDAVPPARLPLPEPSERPEGSLYIYRIEEAGADKQIAPVAGVTQDVLVLGLLPAHVSRLLAKTPVAAGGVLARTDRPLAAAVSLNWTALIDALTPWVSYGLDQAMESAGDNPLLAGARDQIGTALKVLRCFHGVTAVTYREEGVWVAHFESRFEDLP